MATSPITFSTKLASFNSNIWQFHIKVAATQAAPFIGKDRRVLCQLNDNPAFSCALMPDGDGHFFINLNKERRKAFQLELGDEMLVTLQKDTSEYGLPMPAVFGELLLQDEAASQYFHTLTRGKQRSLIYMVAKPKLEATRLKKAMVITEYLKTNKGKLDFKELNIAFKEYGKTFKTL